LDGLEQRGIPADIDFELHFTEEQFEACRRWQKCGNLVAPNVYPSYLDPACTDSNWWAYSEEECLRLLEILRSRLEEIGLENVDAVNTYTPGNAFIRAARRMGFRFLTGFCAPIVSHDTHWKISHTGCPIGPYFAGPEDYRKPERPGVEGGFLISSMELRNPLTCYHHWSEGPFCPLNIILGDRTTETGEWPIETMAAAEDFFRQGEISGRTRFFHINLQYFTSRKCFDFNERMLEWLVDQRKMGRLAFTGLRAHAERLREVGGVLPQSTWWRGENLGQHHGGRRGDGIEAIISEDASGQWQFRSGHAGPDRHFDYTKHWDFPAFDPKGDLPLSEGYEVSVKTEEFSVGEDASEVSLEVGAVTGGVRRRFCLWKLLDGIEGPFEVVSMPGGVDLVDIVPHPGGTGVSLVLSADLSTAVAGKICLRHGRRAGSGHSRNWGDLILAETVDFRGRPLTRVTSTVPYALQVSIGVRSSAPVKVETMVGGDWAHATLLPGRPWKGVLDGSKTVSRVRFFGVTADQLSLSEDLLEDLRAQAQRRTAGYAAHVGMNVPEGEILRFTQSSAWPAWLVEAARRGADGEIVAMDRQASSLCSQAGGHVVASLHMAADLPVGSKGRAGSAFYDRSVRSGSEEFFPIFYDYGQTFLPGVAGWNQFWRINLGVRGLDKRSGYAVILHTIDPEMRGGMFRITATAMDERAETTLSPEMILRNPFAPVRGVAKRFERQAFVFMRLPEEVRVGGSVNLHLYSDSDQAEYDRYTERPGFAYLSHAWLVDLGERKL
jgi:hypothetical protein